MNPRNVAGLVLLGTFIVACSTEAGGTGTGAETTNSEAAQTQPPPETETKKDDGKAQPGADAGVAPKGDDDDLDVGDDDDALPKGDDDDDVGAGGEVTAGGNRVASNNDCCFEGEYFECPDANACFGGFDVGACFEKCGADLACFSGCNEQLRSAGAPKGCTKKAAPANVRCN